MCGVGYICVWWRGAGRREHMRMAIYVSSSPSAQDPSGCGPLPLAMNYSEARQRLSLSRTSFLVRALRTVVLTTSFGSVFPVLTVKCTSSPSSVLSQSTEITHASICATRDILRVRAPGAPRATQNWILDGTSRARAWHETTECEPCRTRSVASSSCETSRTNFSCSTQIVEVSHALALGDVQKCIATNKAQHSSLGTPIEPIHAADEDTSNPQAPRLEP